MIKEFINENLVEVNINVKNREEAIRKGGELLEKNGFIEKKYVEAMIENLKENGAYIVLAPGIAFPHARPEYGAKKIGFSIITLENAIEFGNKTNDPVKLVVCISAVDHDTHLEAFAELVDIMADEEKLNNIMNAKNKNDILKNF